MVKELNDKLVQTAAAINKGPIRGGECAGQPVQIVKNHLSFTSFNIDSPSENDVTPQNVWLIPQLLLLITTIYDGLTVRFLVCLSIRIAAAPDPPAANPHRGWPGCEGPSAHVPVKPQRTSKSLRTYNLISRRLPSRRHLHFGRLPLVHVARRFSALVI